MAKYRIVLDFEADDNITLGMIVRGLEYNDNSIRNAMFSEHSVPLGTKSQKRERYQCSYKLYNKSPNH